MNILTIGKIAKASGIAASAIRYYEREGVLPKAKRRSGRRVYDEGSLGLLRAIQVAKAAGFSVADMRTIFRGFSKGASLSRMWKALAKKKLAALDATIKQAVAMKAVLRAGLNCNCLSPADCEFLSKSEWNAL